ncbi:MAG: ABC transporter permease [Planctomycetes bacterium]|nr:ABC transporter permease [Planctomycetota bacterium]
MVYIQLAWRYATRRLVNFIAIAALALALAVQIVAMSVLDGMLVDLEKRLRNLGEQITLRFVGELPSRAEFDQATEAMLADMPEVQTITPMVQKVGFLEGGNGAEYVWVQGIDLKEELRQSALGAHLLSYRPDPADPQWGASEGRPGMFVGEGLARRLGVRPGDEVDLFYADRSGDGGLETRSRRFSVTSLFRSGTFEKDRYGIYIPITVAAEFYFGADGPGAEDQIEAMVLWLHDPDQADSLEEQAADTARQALMAAGLSYPDIRSDTWQRRWSQAAQGMKHENNLMELVLYLNDAASGFCVFAILVTLVSRRMRDVGLLRCIGASRRGVMSVFLMVGLIIGLAGGILGVAAGLALAGPTTYERQSGSARFAAGGAVETPLGAGESASDRRPRIDRWYEALTGQPLYPPRMFGVENEAGLPTVIYPWKLGLYFAVAVLVAVLAALYPAAWAAWREPMTALREG